MNSFRTLGTPLVFGVFLSCSSGHSGGVDQSGTGGAGTGGKSKQAPGDAGSGGTEDAGMAAAMGDATDSDGSPANTGGKGAATSGDAATRGLSSGGTGTIPSPDAAAAGGAVDGGVAGPATGDGGTSGSGCAGLLFCDDFESYAANAVPNGKWTTQARGTAMAVIDTAKAHSGTKSVHFTGAVNQNSANIIAQGAPVFPVQGNTVFVRMMMYIQGYPTTSGVHTRVARIGTSTNGSDGTGYAMTTYNGTGIERINEAMIRDTSLHLTDAPVTGKWVCWEWELDNTAGPPTGGKGNVLAHLWRDGTAVTLGATSHTNLSWDPVAWQLLEFGLEAYQSDSQAGDFWIDDVAMNIQKIGCPTK